MGSCVSTCRLQANRASNLRTSSVGCLAWPSKPTLHSLPFWVRKKLPRSYSFCVAELGSEARFPRSRFPIASHCPIPLFAPAARELSLELWADSQGPYQPRLWVIFVSAPSSYFHPPCRPPVEQAGHKLSTINKTKTSVLALTLVSWCIFFFFKSFIEGGGGRLLTEDDIIISWPWGAGPQLHRPAWALNAPFMRGNLITQATPHGGISNGVLWFLPFSAERTQAAAVARLPLPPQPWRQASPVTTRPSIVSQFYS